MYLAYCSDRANIPHSINLTSPVGNRKTDMASFEYDTSCYRLDITTNLSTYKMKKSTKIIVWIICVIGLFISIWNIDMGSGIVYTNQIVDEPHNIVAFNGWFMVTGFQLYHIGLYGVILFGLVMSIMYVKETLDKKVKDD